MSELSEQELAVARHYDETIFEYETTRLSSDCPLEFAIVSATWSVTFPPTR